MSTPANTDEVWKPIPGWEHYSISSSGKIWNCRFNRPVSDHKAKTGYIQSALWKNNRSTTLLVHRIVAIAFIPNPENKPCVNHINGIKTDNRVENLEWVTYKENSVHAHTTGLQPKVLGEDHKNSKLRADDVIYIRYLRRLGFSSELIAGFYNISQKQVRNIVSRRHWKHI
jgi:hypothetical protein